MNTLERGRGEKLQTTAVLSAQELTILSFEARLWPSSAAKAEATRRELALTAARYYRILGGLIDSPAALRYDPMLIRRLQRMRAARLAARYHRSPVTPVPTRQSLP
ncbi:MAG: hypothetical protein B5766_11790 [Candidatus Lumbricidophila eiseniae]|uniref:DUF3263 domain-containing protein n=1 Tax=Candidatus Lumbricidiphila eiseniae TaxID=1969409 RepID=A0A2A6FNZ0_9MICO|nr:MAG: hypothetical protein B5766_11790 [Candidatus Lumbricidophila eiseniae]